MQIRIISKVPVGRKVKKSFETIFAKSSHALQPVLRTGMFSLIPDLDFPSRIPNIRSRIQQKQKRGRKKSCLAFCLYQ